MSVDDQVQDALSTLVRSTLLARTAGHCLKVSHVPFDIADGACRKLQATLQGGDEACVVITTPTSAWHATPTKVVQKRNDIESTGSRLVVFVPAGELLAAEDSFGASTFEELAADDIYAVASRELASRLEQTAPALAECARSVVVTLRDSSRSVLDERAIASYYYSMVYEPSTARIPLELLGLVPDSQLRDVDEAVRHARVRRNIQIMTHLTQMGPPTERVRGLSVNMKTRMGTRIASALHDAVKDGSVDSFEVAMRLAMPGVREIVDLAEWVDVEGGEALDDFTVIELIGDFDSDRQYTVRRDNASIGIRYRSRPSPADAGLKELTLEIVRVGETHDDVAETGFVRTKRGKSITSQTEAQWKVRVPIRIWVDEMQTGLHRFRLRAFTEDNVQVGEALSPLFNISEDIVDEPSSTRRCTSLAAALVDAWGTATKGREFHARPEVTSGVQPEAGETRAPLILTIRFDGVPVAYELLMSRLLAQVERYTLDDPSSLGRYGAALNEPDAEAYLLGERKVPEQFLEARRVLFDAIRRSQQVVEGGDAPGWTIALSDLRPLEAQVNAYLEAWRRALKTATTRDELSTLLSIDQLTVTSDPEARDLRIVGPTHPLRISWLLRYQKSLGDWASTAEDDEGRELRRVVSSVYPTNIPHLVPGDEGLLHHLEPIDLHWAIYGPPAQADKGALSTRIRQWLQVERVSTTTTISVDDIIQRIRRYLVAHPYVSVLNLNVVQPGSARLILDSLLALQEDPLTSRLRYVLRLFASQLSRSDLGRALDEFMTNPEVSRGRKEAADAFLSSTDDTLRPKLTYSKHDIVDLLAHPAEFPAHISFFLDWFDLGSVPAPPPTDRRSLFAQGLLVDPIVVYRPGDEEVNPQWDEFVVADPESSDSFTASYAEAQMATARLIGSTGVGMVPAVRLELDRVRRSVLDAVHRASDWVVTIDPVFADEYLDSPQPADSDPRYLIDYVGQGALENSRRIMVSTRTRAEVGGLLDPELRRHGLDTVEDRGELLMDALKLLGAGLPLRLLSNRTQALEALSLALGSIYLADEGVLRHAIAIPLDLHLDLFREQVDSRDEATADLRRTDLAIVQLDPERRRFVVHLVEVKARSGLPEVTPAALIEEIRMQLENSRTVLRSRLFGAEVRQQPGSFAPVLQVRRLSRLMSHYLERARRYGYLEPERIAPARAFLTTLDQHYSLAFEKHALIFDLTGSSHPIVNIGDVRVARIGRDAVVDLLERARTVWPTRVVPVDGDERIAAAEGDLLSEPVTSSEAVPGTAVSTPESQGTESRSSEPTAEELELANDAAPGISASDVMLLGEAQSSDQFGVIGRIATTQHLVALDTGGTNVISVFGVQGSGKSYTVGTLLEACLLDDVPEINRLPHPLAGVVFHYSAHQTYVPEFASMGIPNQNRTDAEQLWEQFSVAPTAVSDILLLVPEDKLTDRRAEFPSLEVHPLILGPDELGLTDFKLLLGLEGGDQMYARAMNLIVRQVRGNLSLRALRAALDDGRLTPQQKNLAQTRIDFAETFVRDGASVATHIRPGRLVIVDLRDELVEEEEALMLFMVLLNRFAQATAPDGVSFNKIIVFDEAHKYMSNPRLTGAIENTVREMRHRGVSVVLASQNPPSIPKEIIELSTIVIAHKFTSPLWLDHVRRVNDAFGDRSIRPSQLAGLPSGEAYVWSSGGAEAFRRPQRVRMRPRLTQHGGETRRAGGE